LGEPVLSQEGTLAIYRATSRKDAIAKYEQWLRVQPELMAMAKMLKGKRLGCWCAPRPCHGDVLVRIAEET
jgi:hypothetical protein